MEQLQRDRNYSNYLIRLVEEHARSATNKDDLLRFINEIGKSINSAQVITYVQDNHLLFDYQVYSNGVKKILEEYDRTHEAQINSSDYKQMQVDNTNYVVSKEGNALEQDASKNMGDLAQDFKNKQNEMVGAKTDDSLVNADETFNIMKSEMEESNFMPLTKVDVSKVSQDLIMKINFLIKNANVNYNEFQVDIKRGIFMNTKENELYEVRKDPQTNQYKLYKGQQAVYTNNALDNNNVNTKDANNSNLSINDLAMFSDEELKTMGSNKSVTPEKRQAIMDELNKRKAEVKENTNTMTNTNVKKKTLVKDKITPILNNGYVSTILLTVGAAITGIIIAAILLMNK